MTWIEELERTAEITPHFVLTGNTWDFVVSRDEDEVRALPVLSHLIEIAERQGLRFLVIADPVRGFALAPLGDAPDETVAQLPGPLASLERHDPARPLRLNAPTGVGALAEMLATVTASPVLGGVAVVDAGRWVVDVRHLSDDEHALFTLASAAAQASPLRDAGDDRVTHSAVFWICRTEFELPSWYLADPCVRTVTIPSPDRADRRRLGTVTVGADQADAFADATDAMSARELLAVARLTARCPTIADAATLVRLGVTDDPWTAPDLLDRVRGGRARIASAVRGQPAAVDAAWAAITRSIVGLSGIHRPSSGRRPKMVLFLAGPTGTGKTELAKSIAELLFGTKDAIVRFDMSGYPAEHSSQRLVGAPPGYVGHEAGGELPREVRRRPFSVFLFDEMEKAHPSIFDIFLQILDEGHLDDSLGRRVYFDQTVIIFTSNLGVSELVEVPGAAPVVQRLVDDSMSFEDIEARVTAGVRSHFIDRLGRPEVVNRIGDNIVSFDFLRPDAASEVFGILVDNVIEGVQERRGVSLTFAPDVLATIEAACCADRSMGGRGITNKVESLLVDPLARWMFDHIDDLPSAVRVTAWHEDGPTLEAEGA